MTARPSTTTTIDRLQELTEAIEDSREGDLLAWARDEIVALRRGIGDAVDRTLGVDAGLAERTRDAPRSYPAWGTSTSHPSLPSRFRSRLYYEREGWDAHVKVDHDAKNSFSIQRVRSVVRLFPAWFGDERVLRAEVYRSSRKEDHHHVRIWFRPELPRFPASVILALQEHLGDDPVRQKLNEERVERNEPGWNVLWQEKFVNGVSVSREVLDAELTGEVEAILKGRR